MVRFYLTFDSFDRLKNNNDENWYSTDLYKLEKTKEAGVKHAYRAWTWLYGNILSLVGPHSTSHSGRCYSRPP